VVVPRRNVAEFVMYSHDLQQKHQIRIRSFGHAGDGNLHIYILRDELEEKVWQSKLAAVFDDLYRKASELGGKVSGEHGIGFAKRPYLAESLSPAEKTLMHGIKQVFDPLNILNPGKVVC
jgi:glycolate oxidase